MAAIGLTQVLSPNIVDSIRIINTNNRGIQLDGAVPFRTPILQYAEATLRADPTRLVQKVADLVRQRGEADLQGRAGRTKDLDELFRMNINLLACVIGIACHLFQQELNDEIIGEVCSVLSVVNPEVGYDGFKKQMETFVRTQEIESEQKAQLYQLIIDGLRKSYVLNGPVEEEDNTTIEVIGSGENFLSRVDSKGGVIQFSDIRGGGKIKVNDINDLKKLNGKTLVRINAYAYYKLLLYAPPDVWDDESMWLYNRLQIGIEPFWHESPADRFLIFLYAWAADMLSRANLFSTKTIFSELLKLWKQKYAEGVLPQVPTLLENMKSFSAHFNLDFNMFPLIGAVQNPMIFLTDDPVAKAYAKNIRLFSVMINCAKEAIRFVQDEGAKARSLAEYNGTPTEIFTYGSRTEIYGLNYYLEFLTHDLKSHLELASGDLYNSIDTMKTFLAYVKGYSFNNGSSQEERYVGSWSADRANLDNVLKQFLREIKLRVETRNPPLDTPPSLSSLRRVEEGPPAQTPQQAAEKAASDAAQVARDAKTSVERSITSASESVRNAEAAAVNAIREARIAISVTSNANAVAARTASEEAKTIYESAGRIALAEELRLAEARRGVPPPVARPPAPPRVPEARPLLPQARGIFRAQPAPPANSNNESESENENGANDPVRGSMASSYQGAALAAAQAASAALAPRQNPVRGARGVGFALPVPPRGGIRRRTRDNREYINRTRKN
uniref:Uncharacterized protein n=1 Tax=viral metagenome TaxID=1070528 RepID=A0A6C0BHQ8_9ZZZZ